jgi:hypothetical protein
MFTSKVFLRLIRQIYRNFGTITISLQKFPFSAGAIYTYIKYSMNKQDLQEFFWIDGGLTVTFLTAFLQKMPIYSR